MTDTQTDEEAYRKRDRQTETDRDIQIHKETKRRRQTDRETEKDSLRDIA